MISLWRSYEIGMMDVRTLDALSELVEQYIQTWGRRPTGAEIKAALHLPDKS